MINKYWAQPNLSPTFQFLVHFSHCFMDICNWIPHSHLKINMSTTKLLIFLPSQFLLRIPPFINSYHSPKHSPLSLIAVSHQWVSFIFIFPFLSIPFHSHLNPGSGLDCYLSLLLVPGFQSLYCSKVPLWLCFSLVENPSAAHTSEPGIQSSVQYDLKWFRAL